MARIDLTPFGFTPTESLVYQVLLNGGPGTGYAIARSAGLARANAYSALEGLVLRAPPGSMPGDRVATARSPRPRCSPGSRTTTGEAVERLTRELESISVLGTPTLVEIDSGRSVLQSLSPTLPGHRPPFPCSLPPTRTR